MNIITKKKFNIMYNHFNEYVTLDDLDSSDEEDGDKDGDSKSTTTKLSAAQEKVHKSLPELHNNTAEQNQ